MPTPALTPEDGKKITWRDGDGDGALKTLIKFRLTRLDP